MELKELKCPNCKAKLTIDKESDTVKCEYCDTVFHVSDIEKREQEFKEKVIEETVLKPMKSAQKTGKIFMIIFIPIFILFFGFVSYNIAKGFIEMNKRKEEFNNNYNRVQNIIDSTIDEITNDDIVETEEQKKARLKAEAYTFNFDIEHYAGKQARIFMENLLTNVITNNKKNERKITVSHEGVETTDTNEITNIKNGMPEWSYYDVSFDYDEDGFIYKLTMTKLS